MTFIATVVAQKGAAIIADSLATTMEEVIFTNDVREFFKNFKEGDELSSGDIYKLSQSKPNYTKNYAQKLFQLDKYTAVTIAGQGAINEKSIESLINELIATLHIENSNYESTEQVFTISELEQRFVQFIEGQAVEHLNKYSFIGNTVFYLTNFSQSDNSTTVHKITVGSLSKEDFEEGESKLVTSQEVPDFQTVICDGQNGISDRILYGDFLSTFSTVQKTIELVFKENSLPDVEEYKAKFFNDHNVIEDFDLSDSIKMFKLNRLSLQQAVDLASLLMRIERDMQSFTENIPNVGGVIKMAVIDKDGFRMITGDKVVPPVF